jgi:hypothetical protein
MKIKLSKPSFKIKIPKVTVYGIDVIKNSLFFALYIIITIFAIAFIIAPSIKTFKKYQSQYYKAKSEYDITKNDYENTLFSLHKLQKQNRHIINAFKRNFDENNFKLFASKYMKVISIDKNSTSVYKKDFLRTVYYVKAIINSPEDFYKFIDALKDYKYIIKVYFPIDFTKTKNNKIALTLKIEHYKLKKQQNALLKAH